MRGVMGRWRKGRLARVVGLDGQMLGEQQNKAFRFDSLCQGKTSRWI